MASASAETASLGSRPELSLRLLLSVSEELDVDNCCLNRKQKTKSSVHTYQETAQGEFFKKPRKNGT